LSDALEQNHQYRGVNGTIFVGLAGIALALAAIGLYAVLSYSMRRRQREMAIRQALGATKRDILTFVFRKAFGPVILGLAVGMPCAALASRVLKSQLVGVSPVDPYTYIAVTTILLIVSLLGCYIPARSVMKADPVMTLRHE
jgi:putative ABC transport system permease protein